ncbi:MAG: cbb3-type cytochrome c oxidase subunit I, partial [Candidatus Omnitrophica bacterium]|nr:cbb3-type cytochrome c oxidase subunit I [Candidatus Omnitrophota bacterium]
MLLTHAPHSEELPFWRKYIFSLDHKVIGIQYAITGLLFLLFGFGLMMLMRWQLAFPGKPLPVIGGWFAETAMVGGIMLPEFYNQLGAMHGTIMVFLGVVPLAVGGFGNFVLPLQIGAPDMAFPKLNMMSFWLYFTGGVVMFASFFVPGGAAQSGWTSYPPLAVVAPTGQTLWLIGMAFLINSSLLGSINFIVTTLQLRAEGMHFFRLPFFVWAQFVTSFLLLLAFPPLMAAAVLQLMDRLAGTSFFIPSGLVVNGAALQASGGGNPILWQHLFWFLAHPEVYVLILPAMGIVAEVIACNTRKPLYGYKALVYSVFFLGFMSFIVWAHHMFLTGMGPSMSAFFQITTMIISIPSVVVLTTLVLSLWGGSIRFNVPMLFALAFLPMFGIGGLTGLPLGLAASDIHLHDTYYVIGHFHYVVAPGTIFALFAGVYHWFPKATGRQMSERLGKIHFWTSFVLINCVFMPMFLMGLAGVSRRLYDPVQYAHAQPTQGLNVFISSAAWLLGLAQIPFILNFFGSLFFGKKVGQNPWQATTL